MLNDFFSNFGIIFCAICIGIITALFQSLKEKDEENKEEK